jgi:flagella basal body P-ring formation protein FlgA
MQMLCHKNPQAALQQGGRVSLALAGALCLALVLGWAQALAQTAGEAALSQENLFKEVGNWMQQTQQLSAGQFDFVPLDTRVKVQPCDRPLAMDLPFATKETIRVRCLGATSWQLYLRANIKAAGAKPAPAAPATGASSVAMASTPLKSTSSAAPAHRKVVVGTQFLRAGTVLSAAMLEETEQAATAADNSLFGSLKDLENAEVVRDIAAGTALRSSDVRRALLVKQGQLVMLTISQGNSFAIVARVEALQDGRLGDQIRLKNPESGRLLSGVVTGPNAAKGL